MAKKKLTVASAVAGDLAEIAKRDRGLAKGSFAASALSLARELDDPDNSATSKSMCAKALLETMNRLRELAPDREEKDKVDELGARRKARRSRTPRKAAAARKRRS